MMKNLLNCRPNNNKILICKCHVCGEIMEVDQEPKNCTRCRKAFLPSNYFTKIHGKAAQEYAGLFSEAEDLHDDDLIKGLQILW